jgi:hypothetical protein
MDSEMSMERILEKIEELRETDKEICAVLQRLTQYVLIIGALNGTATAGKLVSSVVNGTDPDSRLKQEIIGNVIDGTTYSRQEEPSEVKAVN